MLNVGVLTSKEGGGLKPALHALRERTNVVRVLERRPPRGCDRKAFDAETAALLRGCDVVVLLGYLFIITEPLLSAFPGRIFNVHDSDLPRYPGLHATRDAILAGERETRSSVHVVTAEVDAGPVVARSEAFPVAPFVHDAVAAGQNDIVRAYAYAHREWMIRSRWGALVAEAIA